MTLNKDEKVETPLDSAIEGKREGKRSYQKRWKCPNPDCEKWVSGDECKICKTGYQVKKDLDAMLEKRRRNKIDERKQWAREYPNESHHHNNSERSNDYRDNNRRGGHRGDGEGDRRGYGGGGRGRNGGGRGRDGGGGRYGRNDNRRNQNKNRRDGNKDDDKKRDSNNEANEIPLDPIKERCSIIFGNLADELDCRHDKMERIVKLSRDITVESKRIIFHLHRIQHEGEADIILKDVETRLYDIRFNLWRLLALELKDEDHYQFLRQYTAGLQEWIEALSFYHYISSNKLISWEEVQDQLIFPPRSPGLSDEEGTDNDKSETTKDSKVAGASAGADKDEIDAEKAKKDAEMLEYAMQYYGTTAKISDDVQLKIDQMIENGEELRVTVPQTDFVLGLADLTGELMRNAINSLSSGDRSACFTLLQFLQTIHGGFLTVEQSAPRSVSKKMGVLKQSMRKVEDACYAIAVRGSEIPDNFVVDLFEKNNDDYGEEH